MEKEYYGPKIEEFHVGFEYEYQDMLPHGGGVYWVKGVLKSNDNIESIYESNDWYESPRVKYLDKDDIESLGFNDKTKHLPSPSSFYKIDSNNVFQIQIYWDMLRRSRENLIRIYKGELHNYPYTEIFRGNIKNKSELKVLLNQLGITNNS